MALIEEFDKQGSFLFRWRSYVPGVIVLLSFFYVIDHKSSSEQNFLNMSYIAFSFFVSLLGLFVRSFTIGFTPEKTSGRNTKKQVAETVNQTGIYSLVRHPLYIGNFFLFFGIVLLVQSLSFTLIFVLFYWMYYERIMFTEEMFLRNKFGVKYSQWADKTPALIPSFKNYKSPQLSFSFKNVLKREYPTLFGIVLMFLIYDLLLINVKVTDLTFEKIILSITPVHKIIFISNISFYIVVRFIVKFTKLLNVEGR
jgi:lipid A Kdo2 1-phosphate O-methyltransferase